MVRWEYQVIEAPQSGVPASQLNDSFGKEGWQLTGIIPKDKDGTGYYFYFCRAIAETTEEVDETGEYAAISAAEETSPPGFAGAVDAEEDAE